MEQQPATRLPRADDRGARRRPVEATPFLTGFRDSDSQDCAQAWGRPAGVAVGAQGELFVTDDENGNVYRVVYVGS